MLVSSRRPLTLHGERVLLAPSWLGPLAAAGIGSGCDWQLLEGDSLVAQSATAKCFRMQLANDEWVYFKRDVYSPRRRLGYLLRATRNAVEAYAYGQCVRLGIGAPELLGVAEQRRFGMPISSFVVTREIAGSKNLLDYVREDWMHLPAPQRLLCWRTLATLLIEQLRLAHNAGFFHQDLKFRNLLVREESDGPGLYWIDAPRARRLRWRTRRGVIVDLSGLARVAIFTSSHFERMRFIRSYLGPDAQPGEAAKLYRQVAAHLSRRMPKPLALQFPENS